MNSISIWSEVYDEHGLNEIGSSERYDNVTSHIVADIGLSSDKYLAYDTGIFKSFVEETVRRQAEQSAGFHDIIDGKSAIIMQEKNRLSHEHEFVHRQIGKEKEDLDVLSAEEYFQLSEINMPEDAENLYSEDLAEKYGCDLEETVAVVVPESYNEVYRKDNIARLVTQEIDKEEGERNESNTSFSEDNIELINDGNVDELLTHYLTTPMFNERAEYYGIDNAVIEKADKVLKKLDKSNDFDAKKLVTEFAKYDDIEDLLEDDSNLPSLHFTEGHKLNGHLKPSKPEELVYRTLNYLSN